MKNKSNIVVAVLIVVVLAVAIFFYAASQVAPVKIAGLRAVIHDGDGGVQELALDKDAELPVTTSYGTNVVVVQGGSVFVRVADCDNQDCVHQGKLNKPGGQIICLPHKLWIEVLDSGDEGAADMNPDAVIGSSETEDGNLDTLAR